MSDILDNNIKLIEIKMLGGFSIKVGDRVLDDSAGRTKKCFVLLEYLIANRNTEISTEKLIELIWGDDESDNPANALKNLIYRIRGILAPLCEDEKYDFIIFNRNNYFWNNKLPCKIDIEEFEAAYKTAKRSNISAAYRLEMLNKAISLYGGEFLPKSSMEDWVILNNTRYTRMFMECVKGISELYAANGEYDEIIAVCEKALTVDTFDETLHELLLRAYLKAGRRQKAISHYEYASELFYEKLGIKLSENVRTLMRNEIKTESGIEKDLDVIKDDLKESQLIDTAYYCDYEIFKNLYRIEARLSERFGQSVFVALLTLEPFKLGEAPQRLNETMQLLKAVILNRLRKSDIVSRYSSSQYILMLPALTFENGQMVLKRIVSRFNEEIGSRKQQSFFLGTKLNPLNPAA